MIAIVLFCLTRHTRIAILFLLMTSLTAATALGIGGLSLGLSLSSSHIVRSGLRRSCRSSFTTVVATIGLLLSSSLLLFVSGLFGLLLLQNLLLCRNLIQQAHHRGYGLRSGILYTVLLSLFGSLTLCLGLLGSKTIFFRLLGSTTLLFLGALGSTTLLCSNALLLCLGLCSSFFLSLCLLFRSFGGLNFCSASFHNGSKLFAHHE